MTGLLPFQISSVNPSRASFNPKLCLLTERITFEDNSQEIQEAVLLQVCVTERLGLLEVTDGFSSENNSLPERIPVCHQFSTQKNVTKALVRDPTL